MDCDKCLWLLSTGKCVKALTNSECEFKRRCEVCDEDVGDFKYKDMENGNQDEYGIISIPEIGIMKRNQRYNIIIGCDGLWDCYNEIDVRNYIISFDSRHELPSYYMFENEKRNRMYKLITNVDQGCAFNLGMSCIADDSFINETCGYDNVTILMASC